MKDKTELLHERALLTCIIMLFLCIILKLFGVPWFDMETDIPILQKINELVSNNIVISFIVTLFFKVINGCLICSLVVRDMKKIIDRLYLIIFVSVISMILGFYNVNSFIFGTLGLYFVCFALGYKSVKEYIVVFIFNIIYQCISLYIKDLGVGFKYYGFIENKLLSIDYYIMLSITYLYLKKGEITLCGEMIRFGSFLANLLWRKPLRASRKCLKSKEGE